MKIRMTLLMLILFLGLLVSLPAYADYYRGGDFEYTTRSGYGISIIGYTGSAEELSIPAELNGVKVKEIGHHAFSKCSTIKSVIIPEGVEEIGNRAFFGCSALTRVTLPGSVTSIGYSAFENCTSLRDMNFPASVRIISNDAFNRCYNLHPTYEAGSAAVWYFKGFTIKQIAWRFPKLPLFCAAMGLLAIILVFLGMKNHERYLSPYHRYGRYFGLAAILLGATPVLFMLFLMPEYADRYYGHAQMGFAIMGTVLYPGTLILGLMLVFRRRKKPVHPKKEIKAEDLQAFLGAAANVMEEARGGFAALLQELQEDLQDENHVKLKSGLKAAGQIVGRVLRNSIVSRATDIEPMYLDNHIENLGDPRLRSQSILKKLISASEASMEKLRSSDSKVQDRSQMALMMYCRDTKEHYEQLSDALKHDCDLFAFMACYLETLSARNRMTAVYFLAGPGVAYGQALRDATDQFMKEYC